MQGVLVPQGALSQGGGRRASRMSAAGSSSCLLGTLS